jgi:hypothetical protein
MASSAGDVCVGIFILVFILLVIITFFKLLKYAGYLGQYRTGKAMKKMSNQGLTINQGYNYDQQYQPAPQQQYAPPQQYAQPAGQTKQFCPNCGAAMEPWYNACPKCGHLVRPGGRA